MKYLAIIAILTNWGCSSVPKEPASPWASLSPHQRSVEISHQIWKCKQAIYKSISDHDPPQDLLELCLTGPPDDFLLRLEQRASFLDRRSKVLGWERNMAPLPPPTDHETKPAVYNPGEIEHEEFTEIVDTMLEGLDEAEFRRLTNYLGIKTQ